MFNKEITEHLLSRFRNLGYSPKMDYFMPVSWNNKKWVGATNGGSLILIEENETNKVDLPVPVSETVNIEAILPEIETCFGDINIESFVNLYVNVPLVEIDVNDECPSCDGDGRFEHYNHYYWCKKCNETGYVPSGIKTKVKDPETVFGFTHYTFTLERLKELFYVIKAVEAKQIKLFNTKNVVFFLIDDKVLVGIVSNMFDFSELKNKKVVKIEVKNFKDI